MSRYPRLVVGSVMSMRVRSRRMMMPTTMIVLLLQVLLLSSTLEAFQPPRSTQRSLLLSSRQQSLQLLANNKSPYLVQSHGWGSASSATTPTSSITLSASRSSSESENEDNADLPNHHGRRRWYQRWGSVLLQPVQRFLQRRNRRWVRTTCAAAAAVTTALGVTAMHHQHMVAHASAPVMALPKAEGRDPATDALMERERQVQVETQRQLQDMARQARQIEATQGEAARVRFEKEYQQQQQEQARVKIEGKRSLQRQLLVEQGIDPFTDIEGKRQMVLYDTGVDLGEVPGTPFHLEQEFSRKSPKKSWAVQKATHRKIISCMAQDLTNRGLDPVTYFETHTDKTYAIMDLTTERAAAILQRYQTNLDLYGQVTPPPAGEMSAKEKLAAAAAAAADPALLKKQAQDAAKQQKAAAAADKERAKVQAQQQKAAAAAAAKAAKEQKAAAAAASKAAAAAAKEAAAVAVAADGMAIAAAAEADQIEAEVTEPEPTIVAAAAPAPTQPTAVTKKSSSKVLPLAATFVAVGGGGYAVKLARDKGIRDEEERQRQFRLLMEGSSSSSGTATKTKPKVKDDDDDDDLMDQKDTAAPKKKKEKKDLTASESKSSAASTTKKESTPAAETEAPAAPKKRRLGSMFGKKKGERETDLNALVSGPDAKAPKLAILLAQLLTFGAPGRFPEVVKLNGGRMPLDTFDLEKALELLTQARQEAGISLEESAEIFANVVNCMLITIVDLASTSLKEKDDDIKVKSINIVVDFMNHAASLYDAVAKDVVIKPVTYGGDLSKSKLEQMYSTYTVAGMMGMFSGKTDSDIVKDDFDDRVALLQDVFQINEKKAEGLMMKAVQKNMMQMMKEGKGMEGMEQMLGGMGGLDALGMGGAGGPGGADGEGPSPEQLKEMLVSLKAMKDSGSIPPSEFEEVKKQFKEAFGSSLDDVVKDASSDGQLSGTEKELLELMKSIMED